MRLPVKSRIAPKNVRAGAASEGHRLLAEGAAVSRGRLRPDEALLARAAQKFARPVIVFLTMCERLPPSSLRCRRWGHGLTCV
jgi:hypothetical protein